MQAFNDGKVEITKPKEPSNQTPPLNLFEEYLPVVTQLLSPKRHRTTNTAPTFIPKTFLDSIQLFDDGTTRGVWIYINKTWRKITAT